MCYLVESTVVSCELLLLLPLRHHLARPHVRCATIIKWSVHSVRSGQNYSKTHQEQLRTPTLQRDSSPVELPQGLPTEWGAVGIRGVQVRPQALHLCPQPALAAAGGLLRTLAGAALAYDRSEQSQSQGKRVGW
jgi:hypothetical protein